MKTLWRCWLIGCLLLLFAMQESMLAQDRTHAPAAKSGVVETDSLPDNLRQLLLVTTSPLFQDPNAPRFVMVDRSGQYLFGIGGYVSANMFYDFNRMRELGFTVNDIPMDDSPYLRSQYLGMDMSQSRLFFRLLGDLSIGRVNAYLETDFSGASGALLLKHAYISIRHLTLGKTYSYFSDQVAPATIDPEGPVSSTVRMVPLLGYRYVFGGHYLLAASLEFTSSTMATYYQPESGQVVTEMVSQRFPDLPLSFSYTGHNWHVFFAWNNRVVTHPTWDDFRMRYAYAVQLNARYQFSTSERSRHRFYAQGVYADGMGDCILDLDGEGMNLWVRPDFSRVNIIPAYGVMAGYEFSYGKHTASFLYSRTQVLGNYDFADALYRSGEYASATYVCDVIENAVVGIEGIWGRRTLMDGRRGNDVRINLLLRYDF